MRYLIDLPKNVIEEMRKILNEKDYNNINDFILTAIENQISLESSEMIEEDLFSSTVRIPKSSKKIIKEEKIIDFSTLLKVNITKDIKILPTPKEKELKLKGINYANDWLWGQVNRIFPIKVALRVLLKMQNDCSDYINLNEFLKEAPQVAKDFGKELAKIDDQKSRKRGERVSIALPIGEHEDKAISRYKNHFLAFIRHKDNALDGALARLKFINMKKISENDFLIGLTKEGLEFAKLNNPIIDDNLYSNVTLSEEEKLFYLKHIKKNVPEELNPIKTIINLISTGYTEVKKIDNEIMKIKTNWTEKTVITYRAGALGRLLELGLVEKIKKGVNVTYKLSKNVSEFNFTGGNNE